MDLSHSFFRLCRRTQTATVRFNSRAGGILTGNEKMVPVIRPERMTCRLQADEFPLRINAPLQLSREFLPVLSGLKV
jgi:hypothetical protein